MDSTASVTLYCAPIRWPTMMTRLTTYLLQQQYGFLQTCYTTGHAEVDVFDAEQQPMLHLTVKATNDMQAWSTVRTLPVAGYLAPNAARLLQHLLRLET